MTLDPATEALLILSAQQRDAYLGISPALREFLDALEECKSAVAERNERMKPLRVIDATEYQTTTNGEL